MKIRESIFDSVAEASGFGSLKSRWSSKLSLYPQLPLTKIIHIDEGEVGRGEMWLYRTTAVDYTFCLPNGRPFISIEFDGIGGGYSREGRYYPVRLTQDLHRELKMQSKLEWTRRLTYPLVVVSFAEIERIEEEDSFTILDGIVGRLLAREEFQRRIASVPEELKNEWDRLPSALKHDTIENFIWDHELSAEMDMNPIAREASEYQFLCMKRCRGKVSYTGGELLAKPPLADMNDFFDVEGLKARIEGMKRAQWVGFRMTVSFANRNIDQSAWVRNFEVNGLEAYQVAHDIAEYLAFKRAYLASRAS